MKRNSQDKKNGIFKNKFYGVGIFMSALFAILMLSSNLQANYQIIQRELFDANPAALSHIFFLDSLSATFEPLSSQRIGYAFYENDWHEYSTYMFNQALMQANNETDRDWVSFWYGLAYLRYGKLDGLYDEMDDVNTPWARLWQGLALFDFEYYDSAITIIDKVIREPEAQKILKVEGKYILGLCYLKKGMPDTSRVIFTEILDEYPNSILTGEINYRIALENYRNKDLHKALSNLDKCKEFYTTSARKEFHWWAEDMMFLMALVNLELGKTNTARNNAKDIQELFPDTDYEQELQYISILSDLKEKHIIDTLFILPRDLPRDMKWDIMMRIGWNFFNNEDYERASDNFLVSTSYGYTDEQRTQSFFFLAESEYMLGNYDKAIQYYKMAERSKSILWRETRWGYAWASSKVRDYEQARLAFNDVVGAFSDSLTERALFQVAMTYYAEGKYKTAIHELDGFVRTYKSRLNDDAEYFALKASKMLSERDPENGINREDYLKRMEDFIRNYPYSKFNDEMYVQAIQMLIDDEKYDDAISLSDYICSRDIEQARKDTIFILNKKIGFLTGKYTSPFDYIDDIEGYGLENSMIRGEIERIADSLAYSGETYDAASLWGKLRDPELSDSIWTYATYKQTDCFLTMGSQIDARSNIDQLINDFPSSPWSLSALFKMNTWHFKRKEYDRSIELLQAGLDNMQDTIQISKINIELAKIYLELEKYPEARVILNDVIDKRDTMYIRSTAIDNILQSYVDEGDYQRAIDFYYEFADSVDSVFSCDMSEKYAVANSKLGNIETADSVFTYISVNSDKCGKNLPGGFYYNWSELLLINKEYDRACSLLTKTIAESNNDSIIRKAREKLIEVQGEIRRDSANNTQ